jgi:protein-disulfide isomerase
MARAERCILRYRAPASVGTRTSIAMLAFVLIFALDACQYRKESAALSAEQSRRIEVLIRSQYEIPSDYGLTFGLKTRSQQPGYDDLPITFSHNGKHVDFNFLLSQDGKSLARLQKSDLTTDPWKTIRIKNRQTQGAPDARVTVIVFDDLACPFCARLYEELFPETLSRYNGLVRIAYQDYPLSQIHPWAMHAAINAGCVADQNAGAYWDYVGKIHARYADFSGDAQRLPASFKNLDQMAEQEARVDGPILRSCIKKQDDSGIRASMAEAEKLGVQQTPTIFVNGERLVGAPPVEGLWAAIDRALKSEGLEPPR